MLKTGKIIMPENVYMAESSEVGEAILVPVEDVHKDKMILDRVQHYRDG